MHLVIMDTPKKSLITRKKRVKNSKNDPNKVVFSLSSGTHLLKFTFCKHWVTSAFFCRWDSELVFKGSNWDSEPTLKRC